MGTAAGVAVTVRRPVWCGQRRSGGSPADGRGKRTPPGCAHCADRDRSTKSRCDRVGRLSHPTGQAVIVALRRAQRPVWAPGVRILGKLPITRTDRADSPIAQIRANDRDRGLGPVGWPRPRRRQTAPRESPGGQRRRCQAAGRRAYTQPGTGARSSGTHTPRVTGDIVEEAATDSLVPAFIACEVHEESSRRARWRPSRGAGLAAPRWHRPSPRNAGRGRATPQPDR